MKVEFVLKNFLCSESLVFLIGEGKYKFSEITFLKACLFYML